MTNALQVGEELIELSPCGFKNVKHKQEVDLCSCTHL